MKILTFSTFCSRLEDQEDMVSNRCVIEVFGGVYVFSRVLGFSVGVGLLSWD